MKASINMGLYKRYFLPIYQLPNEQEIMEHGIHVHKTFKLSGYSRVDLRMDKDGNLW
jgi:D-alanine-D-alanine ligase-like ATP-grasp enzyme